MRIRTQFIITMLLFGIIVVIIAASAFTTNRLTEKAKEQDRIAANIAQGASELGYLANDYLIYRESQQLKRWQSRFASLSSQVAALNVDKPEQQTLVRNIQANQQRLKEVFDSTVSAVGNTSTNQKIALDPAFIRSHGAGLRSRARGWYQMLHVCRSYYINRWINSFKQEPGLRMLCWAC